MITPSILENRHAANYLPLHESRLSLDPGNTMFSSRSIRLNSESQDYLRCRSIQVDRHFISPTGQTHTRTQYRVEN